MSVFAREKSRFQEGHSARQSGLSLLILQTPDDEIVGGVFGETFGGLHLKLLWVREDIRGRDMALNSLLPTGSIGLYAHRFTRKMALLGRTLP